MTDPVTNVEIEDVLSSIRRLVSENARAERSAPEPETRREVPVARMPESQPRTRPQTQMDTRPLGRIMSRSAASPEEMPEGAIDALAEDLLGGKAIDSEAEAGGGAEMLVLTADHRIIEEPEADDFGEEAGFDEEDSDDTWADAPLETHHWADDGAETGVEAEAFAEDESEDDDAPEATVEEAVLAMVGAIAEQVAAEEIAAVLDGDEAEAEEEWSDDDGWDASETDAEEAAGAALDETIEADEDDADYTAIPTFSHARHAGEDDDLSALASRIAGFEAAVAERDDQWEPDGAGDGDNAGAPVEALNWEDETDEGGHVHGWEADPLDEVEEAELVEAEPEDEAWADEPEAEPEPELEVEPEPAYVPGSDYEAAAPEADANLFGLDDTVIDEETLRELVAEIVRQELQGTLGERITRNVRKLVRREIHRALTARELD